jgi:DNA repair exonuclease SbcCD ATPase subunit
MISDVSLLHRRLVAAQQAYSRQAGQLEELEATRERLQRHINSTSTDIQAYGKVGAALQSVAASFHDRLISSIETLVTQGLQSVVGNDISFRITSTVRNRQVTLDFYLVTDDGIELDPLDARGGGIAALTGLIMRIVVLRLLSSRTRQILVLDEPLAHLSAEYVPAAAQMLVSLANRLDVQVIMVSHQQAFAEVGDVVYEVTQTNGTAEVKRLK